MVSSIVRKPRHPDAGMHHDRRHWVCEQKGCGKSLGNFALHGVRRVLPRRAAFEHHHELVAANAGDGVATAQTRAQALTHLLQQRIAGRVTQSVVDLFEAVQIDEQQRYAAATAPRPAQSARQAITQQQAVEQTCQRIKLRHLDQAFAHAGGFNGAGDLGRDKLQQRPVLPAAMHLRLVALQHQHPNGTVGARQWHTHPVAFIV